MGIYINGRGVDKIYYQGRPIIYVYTKGRKIWPDALDIILSCYYNGYWIDEYPWTDDTPWTD
jgi:hypothetical protein